MAVTAGPSRRIGLRGEWTIAVGEQVWQSYRRANLWQDWGAEANTAYSGADVVPLQTRGTQLQFGVGLTTKINANISLSANADYQCAVGNTESNWRNSGSKDRWAPDPCGEVNASNGPPRDRQMTAICAQPTVESMAFSCHSVCCAKPQSSRTWASVAQRFDASRNPVILLERFPWSRLPRSCRGGLSDGSADFRYRCLCSWHMAFVCLRSC